MFKHTRNTNRPPLGLVAAAVAMTIVVSSMLPAAYAHEPAKGDSKSMPMEQMDHSEMNGMKGMGGMKHMEGMSMTGDADWPPVEALTADAWRAGLAAMTELNAQLVAAVRAFPPERLDELVPGTAFNFSFLFQGFAHPNVFPPRQTPLFYPARPTLVSDRSLA